MLGGGDDTVGSIGNPLEGKYGTLTLQDNGDYIYVADPEKTSDLTFGQQVQDQFTYTIEEDHGTNAAQSTTLTITIIGGDSGVEVLGINGEGADLFVDEDDLSPNGSDQNDNSYDSNTFTVVAPDGVDDVTIGGHLMISGGALVVDPSFSTPLGNTFEITDYNPGTGVITYKYTLEASETHTCPNS